MKLVRTIFHLGLAEAWHPWLEMRGVIRELGERPAAEIQGPPIVIDMKDKKRRMLLHAKALDVEQEDIGSNEEVIGIVTDKIFKANAASTIPKVKEVHCESIFIEPYALPFHEILILLKDRFLKQSDLVEEATDIGLVFDEIRDDVLRHVQIGPMGKEQLLSMYLNWPRDDVPDNFIFLALRYGEKGELEFNKDWLEGFLGAATKWQDEKARFIFDYLKR